MVAIALGVLLGIYASHWLAYAQSGYLIAVGKVNPTEMEAQGCYFPIGQVASVNLDPAGEPCVRMREFIGKTGTLFFVPDD